MYNYGVFFNVGDDAPRKNAAEEAYKLEEYIAMLRVMYRTRKYRDVASFCLLCAYFGFRSQTVLKLAEKDFVTKIDSDELNTKAGGKFMFCTMKEKKQNALFERVLPNDVYKTVLGFVK